MARFGVSRVDHCRKMDWTSGIFFYDDLSCQNFFIFRVVLGIDNYFPYTFEVIYLGGILSPSQKGKYKVEYQYVYCSVLIDSH